MLIVLLLLIPVLILGASFLVLKTSFTGKEFLLAMGVAGATLAIGWQLAKWGAIRDTEHLNGRITQKVDGTQSCCHCHDVCDARDKNGNCTSHHEVCSHVHDYYWNLETTVGEIQIEDCSGSDDPPSVWVNASVGEPAAVEHGYTNYLLADPDSLFVHGVTDKFGPMPSYPKVFKKYHVNHAIGDNVEVPDGWQRELREINADLGAPNQVDVTVLLTSRTDPTYAQALEAQWLYGPKNSINVVMGVNDDTIQWVRVVTFSKVEMLKVRLRDQLQGLKLDDPRVLQILRAEIQNGFRRTAMADFEYLASTAQPKGWPLAALILFEILASVGLVYVMNKYDVFGDEGAERFRQLSAGVSFGSSSFDLDTLRKSRKRNPFK